METRISENLLLAIDLLKKGELVAFPTETVYGLGASVYNAAAVQKIFAVKGRPADNPLIAHVSSLSQSFSLMEPPSSDFFCLIEHFWPGPLTLVVRKSFKVPSIVSAGHSTIAIRMPSHPIAKKIIEGVGEPLAAPSANLSGWPSPTTAKDVFEDLQGKIPLIIDGGPCTFGIESTVLSLVHPVPTILRPGCIEQWQLEDVLGREVDPFPSQEEPILSPGAKYRHYAPKAQLRLVFKKEELRGPFILSREAVAGREVQPLSAHTLYRLFREADRKGVEEIEIYCDSTLQSDAALMNRLLRAAHESVEQPI